MRGGAILHGIYPFFRHFERRGQALIDKESDRYVKIMRAKRACKPDSVSKIRERILAPTINLGWALRPTSSDLPGSRDGSGRPVPGFPVRERPSAPLFGLAPGGVCRAGPVTRPAGELLPHRFTLTRGVGRNRRRVGGLLSVALSLPSRAVDVIHHHALRSPDFPPGLFSRAASRPASYALHIITTVLK